MKKVEQTSKKPWQITLISIFFFVIAARTLFAILGTVFIIPFIAKIAFATLGILAGIGLLKKKEWAPKVGIITSILGILLTTTMFLGQTTTIDIITTTLYTAIYIAIIVYLQKNKK